MCHSDLQGGHDNASCRLASEKVALLNDFSLVAAAPRALQKFKPPPIGLGDGLGCLRTGFGDGFGAGGGLVGGVVGAIVGGSGGLVGGVVGAIVGGVVGAIVGGVVGGIVGGVVGGIVGAQGQKRFL